VEISGKRVLKGVKSRERAAAGDKIEVVKDSIASSDIM
jgi:hypothetical protein